MHLKRLQGTLSKGLILLIVLLLGFAVVLGTTFAWFTAKDNKKNEFKGQQPIFDVHVVDVFDPLQPWKTDNKQVSAKNYGTVPAFVRVMVMPVVLKDSTPLMARIGQEIVIPDLDTTHWRDGGDGFYYYLEKLMPGETAPNLFKNVQLSTAVKNDPAYLGATLDVQVEMDGIVTTDFERAWWNGTPTSAPLVAIANILRTKV